MRPSEVVQKTSSARLSIVKLFNFSSSSARWSSVVFLITPKTIRCIGSYFASECISIILSSLSLRILNSTSYCLPCSISSVNALSSMVRYSGRTICCTSDNCHSLPSNPYIILAPSEAWITCSSTNNSQLPKLDTSSALRKRLSLLSRTSSANLRSVMSRLMMTTPDAATSAGSILPTESKCRHELSFKLKRYSKDVEAPGFPTISLKASITLDRSSGWIYSKALLPISSSGRYPNIRSTLGL